MSYNSNYHSVFDVNYHMIFCIKYQREVINDEISNREYFWSRSYLVVSVGGAPLEIIKKYIQNQKEV